jgi:hypothetical protein
MENAIDAITGAPVGTRALLTLLWYKEKAEKRKAHHQQISCCDVTTRKIHLKITLFPFSAAIFRNKILFSVSFCPLSVHDERQNIYILRN